MKTTIWLMLSILLLKWNPCSFLACWFCIPKDENKYDFECLQESAHVPIGQNETTSLPSGLSKQECVTKSNVCASMTFGIIQEGKLLNFTTRSCGSWSTELIKIAGIGSGGTKCIKRDIANKNFVDGAEVCFCTSDFCNGNSKISHEEDQLGETNDSTKFLDKLEELEREAETLVDRLGDVEEKVNKIQETIHELKDAA